MYEVPYEGWNSELWYADRSHAHRDYWRALREHVRTLPETYEVPVYVMRDGKLVLLTGSAPLQDSDAIWGTDVAAIQNSKTEVPA